MKILAIIPTTWSGNPGFIAELTNDEMTLLRSGSLHCRDPLPVGTVVKINTSVAKAYEVNKRLADCLKAPQTLRSLADAMELATKAAVEGVVIPEEVRSSQSDGPQDNTAPTK